MSNIEKEYSNKQGIYGQKSKQINSAMDLAQAKGYSVSTKFYDKLISQETKNNPVPGGVARQAREVPAGIPGRRLNQNELG